jgi:hypothetical protein
MQSENKSVVEDVEIFTKVQSGHMQFLIEA